MIFTLVTWRVGGEANYFWRCYDAWPTSSGPYRITWVTHDKKPYDLCIPYGRHRLLGALKLPSAYSLLSTYFFSVHNTHYTILQCFWPIRLLNCECFISHILPPVPFPAVEKPLRTLILPTTNTYPTRREQLYYLRTDYCRILENNSFQELRQELLSVSKPKRFYWVAK